MNRHLKMFTLIALGVGAAYVFSVVATIAPGLFPDSFRMNGSGGVYFEPAAAIVVLVLLGQVLELRARSRTGHKDLSTTQRYVHLSPAATFNAIRLLDGRLGAGQRGDIVETGTASK